MSDQSPLLRIPISEKTKTQLKMLAAKQRISVAELIRSAVKEKLAEDGIDIYDGIETWGGNRRETKDDGQTG